MYIIPVRAFEHLKNSHPAVMKLRYAMTIVYVFGVLMWFADISDTIMPATSFFLVRQFNDSWDPMMQAVDYLNSGRPDKPPLYSELYFQEKVRFIYPPTSLIIPYTASHFVHDTKQFLRGITFPFIPLTIFFLVLLFRETQGVKKETLSVTAGMAVLTFFFYPIMWACHMGQMQTWLNAAFAGLIYFYIKEQRNWAGLLCGLMCLVKPHYAMLILWAGIRHKWDFVRSSLITIAIFLAISIGMFGVQNHLDYLPVLTDLSRVGTAFFTNQSINGFLTRIHDPQPETWVWENFPYYADIQLFTLAFGLLLTATALVIPMLTKEKGSVIDLAIMALTATVTSPIAWDHYYGILLPVFIVLFPLFWQEKGNPFFWPLFISFILISQEFHVIDGYGTTPAGQILVSYRLFGGLILLAVLYGLIFAQKPWLKSTCHSHERGNPRVL